MVEGARLEIEWAGQNPPRGFESHPLRHFYFSGMMRQLATKTYTFGSSKREGHDSAAFYQRKLYHAGFSAVWEEFLLAWEGEKSKLSSIQPRPLEDWADRVYCHTSEEMVHVPDSSVALAFTSPPYNTGKEYDDDLSLTAYLLLIARVAAEVYRVLVPGGRYVVNIANLGRKPYIPLHALFYFIHVQAGFLPAGEIIWQKSKGANSSCAWGSWRSAKAPCIRDIHEYLLVLAKERFDRPDAGASDIGRDEFMKATLSVWDIPPESAKRVGHPAPFPVELAGRVIKLYTYTGDVVLDPFCGSGSTLVAAAQNSRHWVGYDIVPEYCALAERRLAVEGRSAFLGPGS